MRLPFGLSQSKFLLRVNIKKHVLSFKNRFPETVAKNEKKLYLNDYLGGADKKEKAIEMVKIAITLFSEAKLKMRSFTKKQPAAP